MRKTALLLSLFLAFSGVGLNASKRFEFTDCASGGSATQAVTSGQYLLRVTDADVFVCLSGTCAAGGEKFPAGTVMLFHVPDSGLTVSCRSTTSTGDVIFTEAR